MMVRIITFITPILQTRKQIPRDLYIYSVSQLVNGKGGIWIQVLPDPEYNLCCVV